MKYNYTFQIEVVYEFKKSATYKYFFPYLINST